ncbi:hypothetical protein ACVGXF_00575, partial [Enterobacter hormaechei]
HYHIASEPLAPGRGGPVGPRLPWTIINKNLEKNNENTYNNQHRPNYHHTRSHPTQTPQTQKV